MIGLWKFMTCVALLVAAASVFMSAVLFSKIQDERERNILENCAAQNDRHNDTIAQLDELIADIPAGQRRQRAMQGRNSTVLLIEALVPRRDCRVLVRRQVRNP